MVIPLHIIMIGVGFMFKLFKSWKGRKRTTKGKKKMINELDPGFSSKMTIQKLLTTDKYNGLFPLKYLPAVEIMDNGTIFIKSTAKVVLPVSNKVIYVRFRVYDTGLNELHESQEGYDYIELPTEGYLERVEYRNSNYSDAPTVSYSVNIQSPTINKMMDKDRTIWAFDDDVNAPKLHRNYSFGSWTGTDEQVQKIMSR